MSFIRNWIREFQDSRVNFDAEGRCVNPQFWADGLNPDGTRKDGKPLGTKLSPWSVFR